MMSYVFNPRDDGRERVERVSERSVEKDDPFRNDRFEVQGKVVRMELHFPL